MSTSPYLELKSVDEFLDFLKSGNPVAQKKSLYMNGIKLNDKDFLSIVSSERLWPALHNVTSLKIENMPNLPLVVLASCLNLQELEIWDVGFRDDWSIKSFFRPMPKALICGRFPDEAFQKLLTIVDVSALESLECDLMYGEFVPGGMGCQRAINLCWCNLVSLTLHSYWSFQPASSDRNPLLTDDCDLSMHMGLKRLVFTTTYDPDCEEIDSALPRTHVLAQILSTISAKCRLDSLECRIRIPIDHQLERNFLNSKLHFSGSEPLDFFKQDGWRSLDRALMQVAASGQRMDALVQVTGTMTEEKFKLYDRDNFEFGSLKLKRVMEGWKNQMFVGVERQENINFQVEAQIDQCPGFFWVPSNGDLNL